MDTEQILIQRERRFEVADLTGFDAIVSRADSDDNQFFAELLDFSRTGVKFSLPFFAKFDEILCVQFKLKNSDLQYTGNGRVRHIRGIEQNRWQVGCSLDPPLPDEVVGFLAKTTNQERRRFERIEVVGQQGNLLRHGKAEGCEAKLINVSKGGICLWVPIEHRTGERVDFVIANKAGEDEKIVVRIRWQSESESGFRLGCSFADSSSYEKLVECIVQHQEAVTGDSINWYVAAAAILVMFIPPATYFLMGSGNQNAQTATAVAAVENGETESASESTSPLLNNKRPDSTDKQESPAHDKLANTIDVDTDSKKIDHESAMQAGSMPDNDGSFDSNTAAGPETVMHSPLDDFLSIDTVTTESAPTVERPLETKSVSEPSPASESLVQKPSEKTVKDMTTANSASDPSSRRNTVAVSDSSPIQEPAIKNPGMPSADAQQEPSPPKELLGGGPVKFQTVRSNEASTRRVTATHSLDVPSEKIVE